MALQGRPESETVINYLQRLNRCYVLGLYPECVILSRAVLEHAVTDTYRRAGRDRPHAEGGWPTLEGAVDAAEQIYGWLTPGRLQEAHTVRKRGNAALHTELPSDDIAFETLNLTLRVVDDLYKAVGS